MNKYSFVAKVLALALIPALCLTSCGRNPKLNPNNISNVVKAMTTEEKVALVLGGYDPADSLAAAKPLLSETGYSTVANDRLGIPTVRFVAPGECCTPDSVSFPGNAALASSWNLSLIEEVASAIASPVAEQDGTTVLLAPEMSVLRNPLAGSSSSCFSEDPLVVGLAAAAFVNGVQSTGVWAAPQGFAAACQTTNADRYDVVASPRALREIYLRGFEVALEGSDPVAVGASSNRVNGTWAAASNDLLTAVLRDEWGFDGFVTTTNTQCIATSDMVSAGCDFIAAGSAARADTLLAAIAADSISVEVLDRNVERLLSFAAGRSGITLFESAPKPEDASALARRAAAESIVLLENRYEALPVTDSLVENVALFEVTDSTALLPAFGGELAGMGFNIVSEVDSADMAFVIISREGCRADRAVDDFNLSAEEMKLIEQTCTECHNSDKFVAVVLNVDAVVETASWKELPDAILFAQKTGSGTAGALADIVTGVVNPSARLAQTMPVAYSDVPSARNFPSQPQVKKNQPAVQPGFGFPGMMPGMMPGMVPGMKPGFQGGMMPGMNPSAPKGMLSGTPRYDRAAGGNVKADGKSADTASVRIPRRTRSSNFKMPTKEQVESRGTRNSDYFLYQEGIFVGYRFYDSFNKEVSYPFGYGLSYTDFSYGEADVIVRKNSLRVVIDITNTGKTAGREVVQVYAVAPDGSLDKPAQELRAFAKTALLQPGETAWLTIDIPFNHLASFNESSASWTVDAGAYILKIGASSRDIRSEAAAVIDESVSYDVHDVLTQNQPLGELHARSSIFRERLRGGMTGFGAAGRPETFDPNAPAPVARDAAADSAAVQK